METAMVIVVVALIAAGTLGGRHLIRQSQIQAVQNEYADIKKAIELFKDKHGALPGDFANAEATLGCTGCNGNGDGQVNGTELNYFWQHLSAANLIKGSFDPAGATPQDGPVSGITDGAVYRVEASATGNRTLLSLAKTGAGLGGFSPQELRRLDEALDDGFPLTGRIVATPAGMASACNTGNVYNGSGADSDCNAQFVVAGEVFYNFRWRAQKWGPCSASVSWVTGDWDECSVSCGTGIQTRTVECPSGSVGTQTRTVECIDDSGVVSAAANCTVGQPSTIQSCQAECAGSKPEETQVCTGPQGASCSAGQNNWDVSAWSECYAATTWVIGAWGACMPDGNEYRSVTCPPSISGIQTRTVSCPTGVACAGSQPSSSRSCTTTVCTGEQPRASQLCGSNAWSAGAWSACSANWTPGAWNTCTEAAPSCAAGLQGRTVTCTKSPATQTRTVTCPSPPCTGVMPDSSQACDQTCTGVAPATSQACNTMVDLNVLNSVSVLKLHTVTGASYAACITPVPLISSSDTFDSCAHAKSLGMTTSGVYTIDHDDNSATAGVSVQCDMSSSTASYLSCKDAQTKGMTANGTYSIDPDGATATHGASLTQCDMTTDGGGWTLAVRGTGGQTAGWVTAAALNPSNGAAATTGTFKLSDAAILLLTSEAYRAMSFGTHNQKRFFRRPSCNFSQVTAAGSTGCNGSYTAMWTGQRVIAGSAGGYNGLNDHAYGGGIGYFITVWNGTSWWLSNLSGSACTGATANCNFHIWVR